MTETFVKRARNVKGEWINKRAVGVLQGYHETSSMLHVCIEIDGELVDFATYNYTTGNTEVLDVFMGDEIAFTYADERGGKWMTNMIKASSVTLA